MLSEHLTQDHDAASRRFEIIDQHVEWIHRHLLHSSPARILDLGCGPGLYSSRLARLGHTCTGIDYSPASIEYARSQAIEQGLSGCEYRHEDIRRAEYGTGYDLAMLIYGEFNIFKPADICQILRKAQRALKAGGLLLLEPHPYDVIRAKGDEAPVWFSARGGLFSESAHVVLIENIWAEATRTVTSRYFILSDDNTAVTRLAQSFQAYTNPEYETVLQESGFEQIQFYDELGDVPNPYLMAISARRNGEGETIEE
jgi:ubiquinone/menaquinone biosynthesis C-methylase UbiE